MILFAKITSNLNVPVSPEFTGSSKFITPSSVVFMLLSRITLFCGSLIFSLTGMFERLLNSAFLMMISPFIFSCGRMMLLAKCKYALYVSLLSLASKFDSSFRRLFCDRAIKLCSLPSVKTALETSLPMSFLLNLNTPSSFVMPLAMRLFLVE